VAIPGHGEDRIDQALGFGREVLVATVRQSLGVPVDHYAEISFDALAHLVDGVGGVPLYFPSPVRDEGSGLQVTGAGCRTLSGADALALARARHLEVRAPDGRWVEDQHSDLTRMGNAPVLLQALVQRVGDRAGGLGGFAALATLATDEIVLDDQLGAGDLAALGDWSRTVPSSPTSWYFPGLRIVERADHAQVLVFDPAGPPIREHLEGSARPVGPGGPGSGSVSVPPAAELAVRPCS
jgi:LCP family protein required for cell wall assembly